MNLRGWLLAAVMASIVPGSTGLAQEIAEKAAACAACHGDNGVPTDPSFPVIWGQHEGYLYFQLRDYKNGSRKNEIMSPIAAELSREDMKALASYFSKQKWPNLQQKAPETAVIRKAERAAAASSCSECHLSGYKGDSTNPRLGGQSQTYLYDTMMAFKTKARGNNPGMSSILMTHPDDEIEALAKHIGAM